MAAVSTRRMMGPRVSGAHPCERASAISAGVKSPSEVRPAGWMLSCPGGQEVEDCGRQAGRCGRQARFYTGVGNAGFELAEEVVRGAGYVLSE